MEPCNNCGYEYQPTTACKCGVPVEYRRLNSLLTTFEEDLNREITKGGQQCGLPRIWQMSPSVKAEINWYLRELRYECSKLEKK